MSEMWKRKRKRTGGCAYKQQRERMLVLSLYRLVAGNYSVAFSYNTNAFCQVVWWKRRGENEGEISCGLPELRIPVGNLKFAI